MSEASELLPCPFCGEEKVWSHLTPFCVAVECSCCGSTMRNNTAIVCFHKDDCPKELEGVETYEPKLLSIKKKNGTIVDWPDHGYKAVNALLALKAYGITDVWNKRAEITK